VINLEDLMNLTEATIDLKLLKEKRLVRGSAKLLKVLGDGRQYFTRNERAWKG
jgi:uncharacterized membrane protein YgaE (UPF0421/DUF939 family)